jgi:hypothetical protein
MRPVTRDLMSPGRFRFCAIPELSWVFPMQRQVAKLRTNGYRWAAFRLFENA